MNTIKVKNIAELKTRKGTTESTVEVLGYYTEGDGGGGQFYWDNTSTETDNSGTIIQVIGLNTGRWKRNEKKEISVLDFGAKSDITGIFDSTTAISNALSFAYSSKIKKVAIPDGYYLITSTIVIPIGTSLIGINDKLSYKYLNDSNIDSTVFYIKTIQNINVPAFVVSYGSCIKNITFYYPLQLKTNSTPLVYGWTITTNGEVSNGDNILLENIVLVNAYNGINMDNGGQWSIRNVKGQAINIGIRIDRMYDVSRIENIHFWDFWAIDGDNMKTYIQSNATILLIGRADGIQAVNIFGWGHKHILHCYWANHNSIDVALSGAIWGSITNLISDFCLAPILLESVNILQISNVNGTVLTGVGEPFIKTSTNIVNTNASGLVSLSNLTIFNTLNIAVIKSTDGVFKFSNLIGKNTGIVDDLLSYQLVNESTAKVYIDSADYKDVSGIVQIGNTIKWETSTDITTTFPNLNNFLAWDIVDSRVSAITGGYSFLLTGGVNVNRIAIPIDIATAAGLYILELDAQLIGLSNLGAGQFYLRMTDGSINDIIFPTRFFSSFFKNKTKYKIPFIVRSSGLSLDFVFGGATTTSSMEITNIKLYKMINPSKSTIEWVHIKQPNSLNFPLPAILS